MLRIPRRTFLTEFIAGAIVAASNSGMSVMAAETNVEELRRRVAKYREEAKAAFPFQVVETTGQQAIAMWEQLKAAGRGYPVMLGDDEAAQNVMEVFHPTYPNRRVVTDILASADKLRHPSDLVAKRAAERLAARKVIEELLEKPDTPLPHMNKADKNGASRELTREEVKSELLQEPAPPPIGDWPAHVDVTNRPSIPFDIRSGTPLEKLHIALIPTDDWTTVPAHLHWGGWNDCPQPEYHVAALRSWRDIYGAELAGLTHDTMNLKVNRLPQTRAEALELAREYYVYCSDVVDQGTGTLSILAASLMADPWWYFWWD